MAAFHDLYDDEDDEDLDDDELLEVANGEDRRCVMNQIAAAMHYAEIGWPVFVLSRTKSPLRLCGDCPPHGPNHDGDACECLTCHGFYAATLDRDRIAAMVARHPDGMLAVRTGAPSGLVVVDIDPRAGGPATLTLLENDGLLPPTVRQLSGGDGLHLLYAHPGGLVHGGAGKLGDGADVKADGGYFVVAPSVHPGTGRPYRWAKHLPLGSAPTPLHPELLERLRPTLAAPAPGRRTSTGARGGRLLGVLTTLLEAPDGKRETTCCSGPPRWSGRCTSTTCCLTWPRLSPPCRTRHDASG